MGCHIFRSGTVSLQTNAERSKGTMYYKPLCYSHPRISSIAAPGISGAPRCIFALATGKHCHVLRHAMQGASGLCLEEQCHNYRKGCTCSWRAISCAKGITASDRLALRAPTGVGPPRSRLLVKPRPKAPQVSNRPSKHLPRLQVSITTSHGSIYLPALFLISSYGCFTMAHHGLQAQVLIVLAKMHCMARVCMLHEGQEHDNSVRPA